MKPAHRKTANPAEILVTEFIKPLGIAEVAKRLGMTIEEVVALTANQPITPTIANTLAQGLGTTPEFWMNLQETYNQTEKEAIQELDIERITTFADVRKKHGSS